MDSAEHPRIDALFQVLQGDIENEIGGAGAGEDEPVIGFEDDHVCDVDAGQLRILAHLDLYIS